MSNNKGTIRIAQIIGKWVGGGVEAVVMNYYRNIDRSKIQFDFICDQDSTNIPYDEIEALGGRVILIPPYQKVVQYQKIVKAIMKENQYSIVHSHINTLSIFPLRAAKKAGVPIRIAHSHSTTNSKEWKKNLLKVILRPFSKVYATNYFCCSALAGSWLFGEKTYQEGKVYLLNNAIDITKFTYHEEVRRTKRAELGIEENTFVVGHIGRFVQQKNHDKLIEIFKEIHQKNQDSRLLLAGQGPLMEQMKKKVEALGLRDFVMFLGQREDACQLYQVFDVFVLPSLYEGLPVVGIEAQASGLLCVFSDDMTKETKIIEGTQFLSLQESTAKWAAIILENSKNIIRKDTSFQLTKKHFNIQEEADRLMKEYGTLIK